MYKPPYIPSTLAEFDVWFKNFMAKISQYATILNIAAADITALQGDAAMVTFAITQTEIAKNEYAKRKKYLNIYLFGNVGEVISAYPVYVTPPAAPATMPAGLFKRINMLVTKIKNTATYNDNIGGDLGIISQKSTSLKTSTTTKPSFKLEMEAGHPVIKWTKGNIDGIDIYVDRANGNGFVMLYGCNRAKYVDRSPLPSVLTTWTYKIVYRKGVEQFGPFSDPSSIAVVDNLVAMNPAKP